MSSYFEDYIHGDELTGEKHYSRSIMLDPTQTTALKKISVLSLYGDEGKTAVKCADDGRPDGFLMGGQGNIYTETSWKGGQFVRMFENGILLLDLENEYGITDVKSGDILTWKGGKFVKASLSSGGGGGLTEAEVKALIASDAMAKGEAYTKAEADAKFAPKALVSDAEGTETTDSSAETESPAKSTKTTKKTTALGATLGIYSEPIYISVQTKRANGWRCYVNFQHV